MITGFSYLKKIALFLFLILMYSAANAAGYVETAKWFEVSGWACDTRPGHQNDIVSINVWRDDGQYLGGGNAPIVRESAVASVCGGTSTAHGFFLPLNMITLTRDLLDGQYHSINVYMITADGFVQQLTNFSGVGYVQFPGYNQVSFFSCGNSYPMPPVSTGYSWSLQGETAIPNSYACLSQGYPPNTIAYCAHWYPNGNQWNLPSLFDDETCKTGYAPGQ